MKIENTKTETNVMNLYHRFLMRLSNLTIDMMNLSHATAVLSKHWSPTAIITGTWDSKAEKKVPESDLLPSELVALICKVGCYTVRSALRVYKIYEPG